MKYRLSIQANKFKKKCFKIKNKVFIPIWNLFSSIVQLYWCTTELIFNFLNISLSIALNSLYRFADYSHHGFCITLSISLSIYPVTIQFCVANQYKGFYLCFFPLSVRVYWFSFYVVFYWKGRQMVANIRKFCSKVSRESIKIKPFGCEINCGSSTGFEVKQR